MWYDNIISNKSGITDTINPNIKLSNKQTIYTVVDNINEFAKQTLFAIFAKFLHYI